MDLLTIVKGRQRRILMKRKAKERDRTFNTNIFCCTLSDFLMSFQWLKAWSPRNAWGATCAIEFTPMGSGAALRICVTEPHTLEYLPLCFWHLLPSLHSWLNLQLHPCLFFRFVLVLNASSMYVENLHGNIWFLIVYCFKGWAKMPLLCAVSRRKQQRSS